MPCLVTFAFFLAELQPLLSQYALPLTKSVVDRINRLGKVDCDYEVQVWYAR